VFVVETAYIVVGAQLPERLISCAFQIFLNPDRLPKIVVVDLRTILKITLHASFEDPELHTSIELVDYFTVFIFLTHISENAF
jgi:hypothetical protein